jgi:hypothetical protein
MTADMKKGFQTSENEEAIEGTVADFDAGGFLR